MHQYKSRAPELDEAGCVRPGVAMPTEPPAGTCKGAGIRSALPGRFTPGIVDWGGELGSVGADHPAMTGRADFARESG
jgi:hypothetical protein